MTRLTTRALTTLVLLSLGLAAAVAANAGKPPARIVFPIIGPAQYGNDFGDPRPQGSHEGIDILSTWKAPAVAAEAGKVALETNWRAGCMLRLYGASGTEYAYIHLNNDLTARNDNRGRCVPGVAYPKGLRSGARVTAGQPVGYVGDSGDADGAHHHLHFEIHAGGGGATNPYPYLRRAQRLLFYAPEGSPFTLALTGTVSSLENDLLRIRVDALRWWPAGLRVTKVNRTLGIDVVGVEVERDKTGVRATRAADGLTGRRVTVWTVPAPTTRAAQLGKDGELSALRVVLLED